METTSTLKSALNSITSPRKRASSTGRHSKRLLLKRASTKKNEVHSEKESPTEPAEKSLKPSLPTRTHSEILPTLKLRRSVKEKNNKDWKKTKSSETTDRHSSTGSRKRVSRVLKRSNDDIPTYNRTSSEKKLFDSISLQTPPQATPPRHTIIQIPHLPISISNVTDLRSHTQPLTAREDYHQKLNLLKNAVSPRLMRTAREAKKIVKKTKEDSGFMGTVIVPPPAPPVSPIKTKYGLI